MSSGVVLRTITLSGVEAIRMYVEDHVVGHEVPGREGSIIERIGSKPIHLDIHGFFESGAEDYLRTIVSGYTSTIGNYLAIPTIPPQYWVLSSGGFFINAVDFEQVAGHSYPFYHWAIHGVLSGMYATLPSVTSGLQAMGYIVYNMGQLATVYPSYVGFNMGQQASVFPNYVRVS